MQSRVSFNMRFDPLNIKVKQLLDENILGRVFMARIRVAHSGALDKWFRDDSWFVNEELAGGGVVMYLTGARDPKLWFTQTAGFTVYTGGCRHRSAT